MACTSIEQYLKYSWVGEVFYADDKVAITRDTNRDCYEIAYFSDRQRDDGPIRCVPFKNANEINKAVERAENDQARDLAAIQYAVETVKCNL